MSREWTVSRDTAAGPPTGGGGFLAASLLALAVPVVAIVMGALALSALAAPSSAHAATNPASLNPVPLRELDTAPNARYLYTTDLAEAEAAPKFGLTMTSPRPLAYVFKQGAGDTCRCTG